MTACEDFLEAPTKSSMDESVIFSTPILAEGAILGIHQSFGETNSYRGRYLLWYGYNTDIEWHSSSENNDDGGGAMPGYNTTPVNSQMNTDDNVWAKLYEGIERANICIRGLRAYGNPQPGTELGQLLGEALALRAVIYADLVKAWGDVPARFEPITSETLYLPRADRDVIYKQLIADLGEAATLVAWPGETSVTSSVERVNKAFVKGLRARLCLNAAGYSQRKDGVRRSTDPELSVENLYAIARQECDDVIESHTCALEPAFQDVFVKLCQDNLATGGESLWEIPFSSGRGRMAFTFAVRHAAVNQFTAQARGGTVGPLSNVFFDYDLKDTRRDVTCVPYEWAGGKVENGSVTTPAKQQLRSFKQWCFGKLRYEWMTRYVTSTNDDGINKQYMRYAEIILMMAEVLNELEGPDAARPYLKMLRARAFAPADRADKVEAYADALTTKQAMFDAIVDEQALEFCGEMLRKEALIRWNLLKTKLDEAKAKLFRLRDRTGEYADINEYVYFSVTGSSVAANTTYGGTYENTALVMYGLNHGELDDKTTEYTDKESWIKPSNLTDEKINSLYYNNPDANQYWPIWQRFVDGSNGMLNND
jgi:hypothetical protein